MFWHMSEKAYEFQWKRRELLNQLLKDSQLHRMILLRPELRKGHNQKGIFLGLDPRKSRDIARRISTIRQEQQRYMIFMEPAWVPHAAFIWLFVHEEFVKTRSAKDPIIAYALISAV